MLATREVLYDTEKAWILYLMKASSTSSVFRLTSFAHVSQKRGFATHRKSVFTLQWFCGCGCQGVRSIIESWGCLPRAIQELAAMEEGRDGYKKGTRSHMLEEVTRLKHVYTDILNPIFVACSKRPETSAKNKKKR